jgi:hypothetical protein
VNTEPRARSARRPSPRAAIVVVVVAVVWASLWLFGRSGAAPPRVPSIAVPPRFPSGASPAGDSADGPTPPSAWAAHDAGSLTIRTPPGWTFAGNPVPQLVGPKIWFALGTWSFPRGGSCGPRAALRFLPGKGALLWLSETGTAGFAPGTFPARPDRFTLRGLRSRRYECSANRPSYRIRFRDHGRVFEAGIAFGPAASTATRARALQSLSSLRVGSDTG